MKKFLNRIYGNLWKHKWKILILLLVVILIFGTLYSLYLRNRSIWNKAEDYYKRADYVKAAVELKKVSMPNDAVKLKVYGQTMFAVKEFDKSYKSYEKLYHLTSDPFAKLMMGNIANQKKDYDRAIKDYSDIIGQNPNYITAYSNLAMVYRLKGDTNKAIETAKTGITNNPKNTELRILLVSLYEVKDNGKKSDEYKNAVEELRKLDPKNPLLEQLEATTNRSGATTE
jgi:tetratricopeptide (TPR) repeat protein